MNDSFVVDTNVIISAFLFKSAVSRSALERVYATGGLLFSRDTFLELKNTLFKKKFLKYISSEDIEEVLTAVKKGSRFKKTSHDFTDCADPDDNKFLNLAVSGEARSIISGDLALRALNPFKGIAILSPREFLDWQPVRDFIR